MNGHPAQPPALWKTAKNDAGRVYYWNTITKATQYGKPEELMGPSERAAAKIWRTYSTDDGRAYYHNLQSNQTTYELPEVLRDALVRDEALAKEALAKEQALAQEHAHAQSRPSAPQFVSSSGGHHYQDNHRSRGPDRDDFQMPDRQSGYGGPALPSQNEPEYNSLEEAEVAFFKLLKQVGVQPDWSWEQMLRAAVKDPLYRAIKDPRDRRAAFEKFIAESHAAEKEREKERQVKLRTDFTNMLRTHPEITYYTRWPSALPMIEKETLFRAAKTNEERLTLFNDYRNELYKEHLEQEATDRKAALDKLIQLLGTLDLEPYTRWSEAQSILQSNDHFQADDSFKSLNKIDVLKAFEDHIKALERSFNESRQQQKSQKIRRERQNRDSFKNLLAELKAAGKINAGTKWKSIHPLIEDDPRYVAMLGQSGSTPLDLFWDVVEEEEQVLRGKRHIVYDALEDQRFEITPKTTLTEFLSVMETDPRTVKIDTDSLTLIFDYLLEKVLRRNDEDRHQAERQQRRLLDGLRSQIKHLDPPVAVGHSWDQVRSRIESFEEYRALDSDELRRSAFDKFMRRLKEKEEEYEKEHSRRDRDKDRDRAHRNGHSKKRRTRTPEVDAYEADRRKAMADRERNYGKKGVASFSPPPPRARERDDRGVDRYDGRSKRQVSQSLYERRDRETERERPFVSRADPRDRASELDYGDSRPPSVRRRRDSEAESPRSMRDHKRLRRERLSRERSFSPRGKVRSKSPIPAAAPAKEDPGLRSGSEEGEIEED